MNGETVRGTWANIGWGSELLLANSATRYRGAAKLTVIIHVSGADCPGYVHHTASAIKLKGVGKAAMIGVRSVRDGLLQPRGWIDVAAERCGSTLSSASHGPALGRQWGLGTRPFLGEARMVDNLNGGAAGSPRCLNAAPLHRILSASAAPNPIEIAHIRPCILFSLSSPKSQLLFGLLSNLSSCCAPQLCII